MGKRNPDRRGSDKRTEPSLRKRIAAVCAAIAALALLLANVESIVQTSRRLFGMARPSAVAARLVLEDVRIAPGADVRWNVGQWHTTTIRTDDYKRQPAPASDEYDGGSARIPGTIRPTRAGTCSTADGPGARSRQTIATVTSAYDGQAPADDRLQANNLGILLYRADWTYHDSVAAAGRQLLQRPMPSDPWELVPWCGELHHAVKDSSIVQPPVIQVVLRNTSGTPATILRAEARPIRSYGGEAGGGGVIIRPVGTRTDLTITHEGSTTKDLKEPIGLDSNETTMLEFGLHVADAAPGDGPGELLFEFVVHYFDGTSASELPVGNFLLSDRVWDVDPFLLMFAR